MGRLTLEDIDIVGWQAHVVERVIFIFFQTFTKGNISR